MSKLAHLIRNEQIRFGLQWALVGAAVMAACTALATFVLACLLSA
jgi:hypothetical protein